ncbi:MAG: TonB-dependent receptor domain-containing protein, partial [Adhaeribacter sp.]
PKEVLKSMPAHTIKNIEVITNPPAKYEAEGVGGIINIITVKKSPGGYNGSINAGARSPVGYNVGGYLTAKTGKFGFSGYYGHNYNESPSTENNLFRDDYVRKIRLNQRGVNDNHGTFNYLDGNLSFELDSLNLITGNFSFNVSNNGSNLSQEVLNTTYAGTPELSYSRFSKGAFEWHGYDLGLDYQKSFRKNKEQLFTLSYKFNNGGNDSDTDFRLEYTDRPLVYSTTQNNGTSAEHTVQADYVQPIGKNNLEIGLKTITRLNSSDYFYANLNPDNGEYVIDPSQSNNFDYHQDIFAGYTSYGFKKGDWGFKFGARLEETRIDANFASSGTIAEQNYFNLIPSIAVSRKLKGMKNMRLGYTQRIERPGLWYLNPYVNRIDPRNIFFGNPDLRAATNHAFDYSYSTFVKKTSVNTSLFYNFTNNSIQQFTTLGTDSVARTTYGNIGKNQRLGFSLNTNMNLTKNLNVNLNASANFVQLNGVITVTDTATNTSTLTPVSNNGITANVFGYLSYKFGKKWRASGNIGYNSPQILLQGTSAGFAYNSFSVTRMFFDKDKGSINLSISSPFQRNRRFFNELQDTRFYQNSESFYVMRRVSLSFNYRFGKLQSDIARKKRGIKNDDVSGGGQSGGATN